MDLSHIERQLANIRRERQSLEWLVVYLAKMNILNTIDPIETALSIQKDVNNQWGNIVQHVLEKDPDSPQTADIMLMSADLDVLTKNIVEEVKLGVEMLSAFHEA